MAKKISKTLPVGTLVYPKLDKVDVFTMKNGDVKRTWKTNIKFSDEDHRAVDKWLKQIAKDAGLKASAQLPWKTSKDGEITLVTSSGEKFKPLIVGANNEQLPAGVVVGGGTKARVNVTVFPYDGLGGGIKLYLNAVQVIELKESMFGKSPFEATEGYAPEKQAEEPKEFDPHAAADEADADMDDEIPF